MARLSGAARNNFPSSNFAFPELRKEPLENASHVRGAIARFGGFISFVLSGQVFKRPIAL